MSTFHQRSGRRHPLFPPPRRWIHLQWMALKSFLLLRLVASTVFSSTRAAAVQHTHWCVKLRWDKRESMDPCKWEAVVLESSKTSSLRVTSGFRMWVRCWWVADDVLSPVPSDDLHPTINDSPTSKKQTVPVVCLVLFLFHLHHRVIAIHSVLLLLFHAITHSQYTT